MVWTNATKPSAPTWTNATESQLSSFLLKESHDFLLLETGNRIVLEQSAAGSVNWAKATKPSIPAWTNETEPS